MGAHPSGRRGRNPGQPAGESTDLNSESTTRYSGIRKKTHRAINKF